MAPPDVDATPTQNAVPALADLSNASLGYAPSESGSGMSMSSVASGSSSPRKRELVLRSTSAYPLHRMEIKDIGHITSLMQDLARLNNGPVILHAMKARITTHEGFPDPPQDSWFLPGIPNETNEMDDEYIYRRVSSIRRHTSKCKTHMSHESSWNDSVHVQLLDIALGESEEDVMYENITQCRIYKELRDPDPFLKDAKVDYGIFVKPLEGSRLYTSIRDFKNLNFNNHVAHVMLSDERSTPIAISIETKNPKSNGELSGPAQLGTWVRAHFRHLETLPRVSKEDLPILPLVFVNGAEWRVDFAERRHDKMIIWESIKIGSSDSSHGCYVIIAALRRLAGWCRDEYIPWWERALAGL
ncbi:hypothetical protein NW762_013389 [Fusarium torreyae]|uniref:PD-(D/E)XK nuclease-like domain-containing protein n=1 Tax=Fusarium torreyae TaxID=1237075 RepID=A0A9W8RPU2_9HYPO|nr:hypothetical protein NW762_013389 [Fusarium torreyae]